jgi:hypothetical protein
MSMSASHVSVNNFVESTGGFDYFSLANRTEATKASNRVFTGQPDYSFLFCGIFMFGSKLRLPLPFGALNDPYPRD